MNFVLFVIALITLYNGINSLANWDARNPIKRSESRFGENIDNGGETNATSTIIATNATNTLPVNDKSLVSNIRAVRQATGNAGGIEDPSNGEVPDDGWKRAAITGTTTAPTTERTLGTHPVRGNDKSNNGRFKRNTDGSSRIVPVVPDDGSLVNNHGRPSNGWDSSAIHRILELENSTSTTSSSVTTPTSGRSTQTFTGSQNGNNRVARQIDIDTGEVLDKQSSPGIAPAVDLISLRTNDTSSRSPSTTSTQVTTAQSRGSSLQHNRNVRQAEGSGNQPPVAQNKGGVETELPTTDRINGPEPIDKSTATTSSPLPSSEATTSEQSDNQLTKNNRVARQSGDGNGKPLNGNDEELQVNSTVANSSTEATASPHSNAQKNQNIRNSRQAKNSPSSQGGNPAEPDDSREDSHEDNSTSTTSHSDQTSRPNRYAREARHNGATDRQSLPEHDVSLKNNETTSSEPKTGSPSAHSVDASSSIPVTSTSFESHTF